VYEQARSEDERRELELELGLHSAGRKVKAESTEPTSIPRGARTLERRVSTIVPTPRRFDSGMRVTGREYGMGGFGRGRERSRGVNP
jgi:hypothetical protein